MVLMMEGMVFQDYWGGAAGRGGGRCCWRSDSEGHTDQQA